MPAAEANNRSTGDSRILAGLPRVGAWVRSEKRGMGAAAAAIPAYENMAGFSAPAGAAPERKP
jgi:hypothetical protein